MTRVLLTATYTLEIEGEDYFGEDGVEALRNGDDELAQEHLDDMGYMDVFDHEDSDRVITIKIVEAQLEPNHE